jgi:pyruvate,water dikinase
VLDAIPLRALFSALKRIVVMRSRLHLVRARTLSMLRTAALDVDRRLIRLAGSEPGIAFFLRLPELVESTWRPDPGRIELARTRQRAWRSACAGPPAPALFGRGVAVHAAGLPLSGVGIGDGEVTGVATVARVFSDALALEPGGVLVTRSFDPGWAPILMVAGAIVTDVGGLTDEGVVAANALGVPLVIGTRDAMSSIRNGERVRVDPRAGTVSLP